MSASLHSRCDEFMESYWAGDKDKLPKHEKLSQAITSAIFDGFWLPGAKLPAEAEWVQITPCSLGTVQRALRTLVESGLIQRRRGSGTVVAHMDRRVEEPWHMRFFRNDSNRGELAEATTRVISRRSLGKTGPWSEALKQDGHKVLRIDRVWTVDNSFEVYSVAYLLADRFPKLADTDLEDLNGVNFKNLITREYNLPVQSIRQSIRIEDTPDWVLQHCRWPKKAAATVLNVVAYSFDRDPLYYQDFYIPPNPCILDMGNISAANA
ncbi:MAG: GntR family transcriptional regulator [Gammaproteobacteria bacterium]|nr:GntR family transcriptional regulator [Gammaproteobacteria bacterium]